MAIVQVEIIDEQSPAPAWMYDLEPREIDEVAFAMMYADMFHHGTVGHSQLMLIAKMANKLNAIEHWGEQEADLYLIEPDPAPDPSLGLTEPGEELYTQAEIDEAARERHETFDPSLTDPLYQEDGDGPNDG